jgi:hypothetical protein
MTDDWYIEDNVKNKNESKKGIPPQYERKVVHKKGRIERKDKKKETHLNTISTSCIYIPIFIDLNSIWDACIGICEYMSI